MKKVLCVVMCVLMMVSMIACGQQVEEENIYEVKARVFEINNKDNVVAFEDVNGHIWVAEAMDASEFEMDEEKTIVFTDCGTGEDWYDDEIIDILG